MNNSSDPRDWTYVRKYTRPNIHIGRVILYLLFVAFIIFILRITIFRNISNQTFIFISASLMLVMLFVHLKIISIWLVKCYQKFAPISVRSMCRYEPSCSEYMILAIEKYGAFVGIRKGLARIYRCSHGGGGFENP